MNRLKTIFPGVFLSVFIAFVAVAIVNLAAIFSSKSFLVGVSPISIALVFGLTLSGFARRTNFFLPGLSFSFGNLTKFAAVLLGLRLSLYEVFHIGLASLFYILISTACVFGVGIFLGHFFNLPRKLTAMITLGTAICGISAIMATSAALDSKKEDTSIAVAVISVFGFLAFMIYPFIANLLFSSSEWSAGVFLGIGIHDTAQVLGSSVMYEQLYQAINVLDVSVVTKLLRNLFLIFSLPLVVYYFRISEKTAVQIPVTKMIPWFIYLFLLAALVRTCGDLNDSMAFGFLPANLWYLFLENVDTLSTFLLTVSTAAIGLEMNVSWLIRHKFRPMMLGFAVALVGGASAIVTLKIFGS